MKHSDKTEDTKTKTCMHCYKPIYGEAIVVNEHMESGGRKFEFRTRYLHPECARQLADEQKGRKEISNEDSLWW